MKTANIGELVRGKLGNFCFGGIVVGRIESKDWLNNNIKFTYTIKLPCHLYIETTELY